MVRLSSLQIIFLLALLEGVLVLAVELLGGKIIASYFRASFFVWTSVIGITLASLTLGVFCRGMVILK